MGEGARDLRCAELFPSVRRIGRIAASARIARDPRRERGMAGKVVVNRCVSIDGFIAGPDDSMDFGGGVALAGLVDPHDLAEIASATGAMLVGRRTWEVGARIAAEHPDSTDYPVTGPMFLLTHRPLDPPGAVTILEGDIRAAVATALAAAGDKDLEILGADVARQCFEEGLVDEVLVYALPILLGDGVRFAAPRTVLEPVSSARSGRTTIMRFRVPRP
jgi:dihydrofolate reductase